MEFIVIKLFILTVVSFLVAFLATPLWSHVLYRYKLGKSIRDAASAPIMAALHAKKAGTPTMGGVLVWGTAVFLALVVAVLDRYADGIFTKFNFLSRRETWLPLFALFSAALIGLVDDYLNVRRIGPHGGGLRARHRLALYAVIAAIGAWWFYVKLDWHVLHIPFGPTVDLGLWFIPLFIFIITAVSHSVNVTDGLDGLAGGALAASFATYGGIAFLQGKYDLASLCAVIMGALLAFLWFNVNPARFFMGDTGSMSLGILLGIVAFLTNQVLLLPVIGLVFVIESASVIAQLLSKKLRGKKLFRSTPLHHHLEAIGWPEQKVVMRLWIISAATGVIGLVLALLDKTF